MTLFRRTPAGDEREKLTGLLLDGGDHVRDKLIAKVGMRRFRHICQAMEANGGGQPTVRDLCAELSNADLNKICKQLRLL